MCIAGIVILNERRVIFWKHVSKSSLSRPEYLFLCVCAGCLRQASHSGALAYSMCVFLLSIFGEETHFLSSLYFVPVAFFLSEIKDLSQFAFNTL